MTAREGRPTAKPSHAARFTPIFLTQADECWPVCTKVYRVKANESGLKKYQLKVLHF
jgi:hypothetical protein